MGAMIERFAEDGTPLAGGATRNGATRDAGDDDAPLFDRFRVFVLANVAGTVHVEQSADAAAWYRTRTQAFAANTPTVVESLTTLRYSRAAVVNGPAAQASMVLATAFLAPLMASSATGAVYEATVDGVRGFLPHRIIDDTSTPTETQVEGFLAVTAGRVFARLGDLSVYPLTTQEAVTGAAAGLAEMGAAGLTENAMFPERAGRGGTAYGDWLWSEFLKGIDEMLETLNKPTEVTAGAGESTATDKPAYSFPRPAWRRDTGF